MKSKHTMSRYPSCVLCCFWRASNVEHDEEEDELVNDELPLDDETPAEDEEVDDGQFKPFTCALCSVSFSKFEAYREHFVSTEHRYKRRDEKKRRGVRCSQQLYWSRMCFSQDGCVIESSPVEVFVNLLLYNKVQRVETDSPRGIHPIFDLDSIRKCADRDSTSGLQCQWGTGIQVRQIWLPTCLVIERSLSTPAEQVQSRSRASSVENATAEFLRGPRYRETALADQLRWSMACLDVCRKEVDNLWTVERHSDDTGKSDEQIAKVNNLFCHRWCACQSMSFARSCWISVFTRRYSQNVNVSSPIPFRHGACSIVKKASRVSGS